jgi:hypothetical protein
VEKGNVTIDAGPVEFAMSYRDEIMDDQGLCVQVYSEIDGKDTEVLRFDCFDQAPHYHYGPENHNIRLPMDKTTIGTPLGWTLKNIRNNLSNMVRRSGYDDLASSIEMNPVDQQKMDEVEECALSKARDERRTVTHFRGDHIYEAGNIRFGVEFRDNIGAANDRGVAIHVLTDHLGQEFELLAFDCFEIAPHYHYGPRNQDVRVYWDTTTSGHTLAWTLDQFKGGNLASMIDRAGYPTVAANLDNDLVQAVVPSMEEKAWALVGTNQK